MKPTAPPVKRGRPGTVTARYFFITRSTTSRPSLTIREPAADASVENAFDDFAVFETSTRSAGLADDRARIAADERVTADVFAAFDRFEQKRFARAADFAIGRERRFDVGQQAARHRHQVSLRGELQEFINRR